LSEAQGQLADLTAQGFTEMEPPIRQAQERVAQAEAALQNAIDTGNNQVMQAINAANRASAMARMPGLPTNAAGATDWRFAPRRAKGGRINSDEVALVGESGAEFVAGPGEVMSAKTSMGVLQNLMKGIKGMESSVQEQAKTTQNQISNLQGGSFGGSDLANKIDNMISVMERLVSIETEAAGTAKRTFRATKGLQGNMLKGIGA